MTDQDLIERLKAHCAEDDESNGLFRQAASRLETLSAENERLEASLKRPKTCSCMDVFGEDPNCFKHGRGTPWRKANPDICEMVDRIDSATARAERAEAALHQAGEALEVFAKVARLLDSKWYGGDKSDGATFRSGLAWREADDSARTLTIGDFRQARETLTKIRNAQQVGEEG